MSTLVSILLAIVMEILNPATIGSVEIKNSPNQIEAEEVLYFSETWPTVTQIKNC